MKIDKKDRLLFAPLQGDTAKEILPQKFIEDLNSMAFYRDGKTYSKSTAVIKSIQTIGGIWHLLSVFLIIPSPIRNFIYNRISQLRYKLFGKLEACRMPTENERNKILY